MAIVSDELMLASCVTHWAHIQPRWDVRQLKEVIVVDAIGLNLAYRLDVWVNRHTHKVLSGFALIRLLKVLLKLLRSTALILKSANLVCQLKEWMYLRFKVAMYLKGIQAGWIRIFLPFVFCTKNSFSSSEIGLPWECTFLFDHLNPHSLSHCRCITPVFHSK